MRGGKRPTKEERAAWRRRQNARHARRRRELESDDELCPWRALELRAVLALMAQRRAIVAQRRQQLGALAHRRGGR